MNDDEIGWRPPALELINRESRELGFAMMSEPKTGALLRTLAATKPGGRFLELGTGTGVGTCWLLAGMDDESTLDSVDNDERHSAVARRYLGGDPRVTFHLEDGADFLRHSKTGEFDFIFADAWPGKFTHLDEALRLLKTGGIYFVDDLVSQRNWDEGHAPKVATLIEDLERRRGFVSVKLGWASGLMMLVRT